MLPLVLSALALSQGSVALAADGRVVSSGIDADVIVSRVLPGTPEQIHPLLLDLRVHQELWPDGCTNRWDHSEQSQGVGAKVTFTYTFGAMRRRLEMQLDRFESPRLVELDHAGNRGFVSRINLVSAEGGGTMATYSTWLNPPPWPFGKLYTNSIQPVWAQCQDGFLEALGERAALD